jgi:glutamate 5-kinase
VITVVKIGSSSLTDEHGVLQLTAIDKLCTEVAELRSSGEQVVVVTSGAVAAGLPFIGRSVAAGGSGVAAGGSGVAEDPAVLQAASAVGQAHLMSHYNQALARKGLVGGQVLLAPLDFVNRQQYLHARQTLRILLELGVVPIVNENDAVADDEIRFGDNDRLAALVAHLLAADVLVLLTDAPGLLTEDPRSGRKGSLIEEIVEVDHRLEALAGGAGSQRGSGGMVSKLAAARIAAWSGVRAVIASADRPGVIADAVAGVPGVGTVFVPRPERLPARKLWIAFAVGSSGTVVVDDGARSALLERGVSLLPAGVMGVEGSFGADEAVEVAGPDGRVFAKGLVRHPADLLRQLLGRRSAELPEGVVHEVIHRDDLVLLP